MPKTSKKADPSDFSDKYNTKLSPQEEAAYVAWAKENGRDKDVYDYDMRGAWKELMSGDMRQADNGHLGDKYKKPNHPTFSDQSVYHGTDGYEGGSWEEGEDGVSFTPSKTNLSNMTKKQLKEYFQKYEPDVRLNINETAASVLYPDMAE